MSKLIKLGVYVAAGIGTYELLRRTGMLAKASDWLEQNVPQDLKERAYELRDRARAHAEALANQARENVRGMAGYNEPMAAEDGTTGTSGGQGNGRGAAAAGQTMTGPGEGVPLTTDDYDGAHVSHKVGRGVVR